MKEIGTTARRGPTKTRVGQREMCNKRPKIGHKHPEVQEDKDNNLQIKIMGGSKHPVMSTERQGQRLVLRQAVQSWATGKETKQ